jgi:hypothetical protein
MTFWMFTPWPPGWLNAGYFLGRYSFLNSEEMLRARPCPGEFARDGLPLARMRFDAEGVDDDCLPLGVWTLASDKMRRAMSFGLPEIQYFDVDTIQFSTSPSAKNYKIMHVSVTEDVSDPGRSEYTFRKCAGGSTELMDPIAVAFQPEARPVHEIFVDRFFKAVYCTDAFAVRVLEAGCTGVRFLDPVTPFGVQRGYHRTLRGVEEDEWDSGKKVFRSKLVRELPREN